MTDKLPTEFQAYIHLSRYARWSDKLGRRETWQETVDRYINFWRERNLNPDIDYDALRDAIMDLEVMPSMRAVMTAGKALTRDEVAGYNCAAVHVDKPQKFDEILYVLMCGTGMGFSVERQFIAKLPEIPDELFDTDTVIRVHDSKIGWASAYREMISLLYAGKVPKYDVSLVRPAGARLKTFGGRASGSGPLKELFDFTIRLFKKAAGRKLTSIECHSLVCKIAEVVVVGGVRRCLPADTEVFTPEGPKKIKDIVAGDTIVTGGEFAKVLNAGYSGVKQTIIICHQMFELECTPEHKVALYNFDKPSDFVFVEAGQIKKGDCLLWDSVGNWQEGEPVPDHWTRYVPSKVSSVVPGRETDTYDIQVEGLERFTANGVVVHNSALISLSNLSDDRMRHAKAGQWWIDNPHFALANNSVCYTEKPDIGIFMDEWKALYDSKSGERGIFNREAVNKLIPARRKDMGYKDFLVNPCCFTGDMRLLTADGYEPFGELAKRDSVSIVNVDGEVTEGRVWKVGVKPTFRIILSNKKDMFVTGDHVFQLVDGSECEARYLSGKRLMPYQTPIADAPYVIAVSPSMEADVYDFTEPKTHWGVVEGVVVHNSEINLRSAQFCNLTEAVVRKDDTLETLLVKIEKAAVLGTMQATLTNFRYLSKEWKRNCEEERLLGVSLTGIMDHPVLNGSEGGDILVDWLTRLKERAVQTNKAWADKLGISPATAVTCVKPSGTVSSLVNSASGIHARHSAHYIRTVRADKKDPLAKLMVDAGVPCEDDVMKPDSTYVFSFPIEAPYGAVTRTDQTALQQLELWKVYQMHWTEHKPSITVTVKEHEWMAVGAWCYDNFDILSGVSFLPSTDHSYKQAPYQECSKETYDAAVAAFPAIPWERLGEYEKNDQTTSSQELACTGGSCDIL